MRAVILILYRLGMEQSSTIGFIGQGWIGKHYADDFETRGFGVVRYAKEAPHDTNAERIKECGIVFVAVPTPTTPAGFDASIVKGVLAHLAPGTVAVIKSTLAPGTTEALQEAYPDLFVLHSPEFLREASAAYDAAHPARTIIGIPRDTEAYRAKAEEVIAVLPTAPYVRICSAREAELVKYAGNCFLFTKVVFMNMLYDLAAKEGCAWDVVREMMVADERIGASHTNPVFHSGHADKDTPPGRGAGGHCFIKDFAAFATLYEKAVGDTAGVLALRALEEKNKRLLCESGKDSDLLEGVYGMGTCGTDHIV